LKSNKLLRAFDLRESKVTRREQRYASLAPHKTQAAVPTGSCSHSLATLKQSSCQQTASCSCLEGVAIECEHKRANDGHHADECRVQDRLVAVRPAHLASQFLGEAPPGPGTLRALVPAPECLKRLGLGTRAIDVTAVSADPLSEPVAGLRIIRVEVNRNSTSLVRLLLRVLPRLVLRRWALSSSLHLSDNSLIPGTNPLFHCQQRKYNSIRYTSNRSCRRACLSEC
jgi:hypothetical protein